MMPGVGISNYISGENGLGVLMKQKKASDTNRRSSHGHESKSAIAVSLQFYLK